MCNIAGYVGTRPAAPILLDMIRREEGFAGGYFTGIATIHEGKLYYAKLTGDTEHLLANTKAAELPGTIGIIHSRSNSGGGDSWAHPFVTGHGEPSLAYVANGAAGPFRERMPEFSALAEQLIREGYPFTSVDKAENKNYQKLSDGTSIHMSDAMCQLVLRNMDRGMDGVTAISEAFCEMPGDIVGLLLSLATPDCILWSRINRPMMVGFADHGAYLSTTAWTFPTDATGTTALPPLAAGCVYRDRYTAIPYKNPPIEVPPLTTKLRRAVYDIVCKELREGNKTLRDIKNATSALFDGGCSQQKLLLYETLCEIAKERPITLEVRRVEGAREGLDAPKFYMSLKTKERSNERCERNSLYSSKHGG